ncbi:MAG: alpha/beta hydrolase domain-containing protein [Paracoccus sp. (in: a-proteobacteria)]|uniref:alpha/beta hydrolase domain-containing protein n=1 Tax=Paracoccus sp. TaxID=267 RepID=UPI0026DF3102|nr:alpha/beta hydrolase domain-containing protein [Paracoccus sp. (in: a-proteobacteria)]MDO5612920.1 alpha/beta hydrolase domain-containing protein [Paracoccus sp. (in: a-proteobacteria)]
MKRIKNQDRPALTRLVAAMACALMTGTAPALAQAQSISTPPDTGTAMSATVMPMAANGYTETEYFVSGQAGRYRITDPLAEATLIDGGHPYTTRVLVRRPSDPAQFNGTAVIEWLNVSLDQDVDFVFGATRELLLRDGYVWIGVSAQRNGIEAMRRWNPDRYGALSVAAPNTDPLTGDEIDPADPSIMAKGGDVLAWDIFSQIGQLARAGAPDLMVGLRAERLIAASESQSTLKVSSYYNSIQPLHRVYDGFLFYDRSGQLRTDTGVKAITIGTEIFTFLLGQPPQADTDHQRWWEINGAAHFSLEEMRDYVDPMILRDGAFRDGDRVLSVSDLTRERGPCGSPSLYSRVPNGDVLKAALAALDGWIQGGMAPATAARFVVDDQERPQYLRDANGQILGGIRTAARDAPMAANEGIGQGPGFCGPSGTHTDYSEAEMCALYGSHDAYVARVQAITNANVRDRVLLPQEARRTVEEAQALTFACPG